MDNDYLLTEELIVVQTLDGVSSEELRLDDEFFSDSYKNWLQLKKRKGHSKKFQLVKDSSGDDSKEDESHDIYEETNEEMLMDLELYNNIYHMPMLSITNQEWDLFFQELYTYYSEKNLLEIYVSDMVTLNRMALAKSLTNHQKEIALTTYISALKYMESEVVEISDILEMIKRLEITFGMKNLEELVQNADGSYGNYGKAFLGNMEGLEAYFSPEDTLEEISNDSYSESLKEELGENVVSFQKYLSKKKK